MRKFALGCMLVATLMVAALAAAEVPPAEMEARLFADPSQIPAVLRGLGARLMSASDAGAERYAIELARARAARVPFDVRIVTAFLVVDPMRYVQDAAFRTRIDGLLPRMLASSTPRAVREAALEELNRNFEIAYDTADAVAAGWGLTPRASGARRVAFDPKLRFADDTHGTIETTIVSLGSEFFSPADARRFLLSLRASAPKRRIVVLADPVMREALRDLPVEVIETFGRPFTPWTRDPFAVTRDGKGRVVLVVRPNLQPGREDDANMARTLATSMDARWSVAPFPFHNGQVLVMPDAAWISIHTVEIRALQILGLERVPVSTFGTAAGIATYVRAVRQAAKELESLYGRPVRFVHPLDDLQVLGGGGGFDLDSIVTLLPGADGKLHALVGDVTLGAALARKTDWTAAHDAYGFTGDRATLGIRVAQAQGSGRAPGLQRFLDVVATHLASNGTVVERIPLLDIPYSLLADPGVRSGSDFLLTSNNVVLEGRRAAGFASLLAEGDAAARSAFTRAGYTLDLLAPLTRSVILNGGYRCASSHVRK